MQIKGKENPCINQTNAIAEEERFTGAVDSMIQEAPGYRAKTLIWEVKKKWVCIEGRDWEEEARKEKVAEAEASCY